MLDTGAVQFFCFEVFIENKVRFTLMAASGGADCPNHISVNTFPLFF